MLSSLRVTTADQCLPSIWPISNQRGSSLVQHGNLLVARMQITTYNLHVLGSFPASLDLLERTKCTRRLGADTVI